MTRKISFNIDKKYDFSLEDVQKIASKNNLTEEQTLNAIFIAGIKAINAVGQPFCSELVEEICKSWVKDRT